MKKLVITICLALCMAGLAAGQDLIQNTRQGARSPVSRQDPNAIAQLIQDRQQQSGNFQEVSMLAYQPDAEAEYNTYVSQAVSLTLAQEQLDALYANPTRDVAFTIPVSGSRHITLELTRVNITDKDFEVHTSSGRDQLDQPTGIFYRGIVQGDTRSMAAVSIFNNHVRVLITDQYGNYVLAPATRTAGSNQYVLYNDRNLKSKPSFDCGADRFAIPGAKSRSVESAQNADPGDCTEIYVECDFSLYNSFGAQTIRVVDYVLALFNEVALIYANESINIEVSTIFVWTTNDPYTSVSSIGDVLELFGQTRQNNYNGRLAHLLSSRSIGGGLAWLDVLCDNYFTFMADWDEDGTDELHHAGPYGVSGSLDGAFNPFPAYTWDLMVVTHELGHNFGSPHTHACAWNGTNTQIDDCGNTGATSDGVDGGCFDLGTDVPIIPVGGGTIMSYCHLRTVGINLALGFGTQPGNLIRSKVSGASCLEDECSCTEFTDRIVNGAPIPSAVYVASNSISSSGDADALTNNIVVFRAGSFIELTPGFEATPLFLAEVIPSLCGGSSIVWNQPEDRQPAVTESAILPAFAIFPNPASQILNVQFTVPEYESASIRFFNQYGQLVYTLESNAVQDRGTQTRQINLSGWPAGMYLAVLQTASGQEVRYVVVSRS